MKIVYSEIKKMLPGLSVTARQLADDLTLIGHFVSGFEVIGNEEVLDLEVRQNRGDCLGYFGIAKELSVFYNLPANFPQINLGSNSDYKLPIKVTALDDVKRILAIKLSGVNNTPSPDWLKSFLSLHDINSINTVVDLTNYIMILYGIPNHAFDIAKTGESLTWENNDGSLSEAITLDGSVLDLNPGNLVITSEVGGQKIVQSMSFIGGKNSGIVLDTKDIIIEMAVYNRSRVRRDSRSLKTITEASTRLDKELDVYLIPQAFNHLISLILEASGAQITSAVFDYFPNPTTPAAIPFHPEKPSLYAGISISSEYSLDVLSRLGCTLMPTADAYQVTPPTIRKDIELEEDLIEEVVRFYGYNKIPLTEPIDPTPLPDITPPVLYLEESLKNILVELGYDEVRSWPLIKESSVVTLKGEIRQPIYTQNSINSEFPLLRSSIISSLIDQNNQYNRYKVPYQKFFEIGKIFYRDSANQIVEKHALGIYNLDQGELTKDINTISSELNVSLTPQVITSANGSFTEIILDPIAADNQFKKYDKNQNLNNTAIELTHQIITLDANIVLSEEVEASKLVSDYSKLISTNILWEMKITDVYADPSKNTYKYTFRVSYYNTDDKTAKKAHLRAFNL